jgi:hypothetical protein
VTTTSTNPIDLESPDDVALADRMNEGKKRIVSELRKLIIGQEKTVEEVLRSSSAATASSSVCRAWPRRC